MYNQTVLKYNPYTKEQTIIEFPGISGNASLHVSGIDFDHRTGAIYISANSAAPFSGVFGLNLYGPNYLIKYDTYTDSVIYTSDMAEATAAISAAAGQSLNGYQDMAEDTKGNSYYIVTFGSAVVKVNPAGKASVFLEQPASEITDPPGFGYGGIVAVDDMLVISKNTDGVFVTIDTACSDPSEIAVVMSGLPANLIVSCDGVLAPARYSSKVILCSQDATNAIDVYHTTDNWKSGSYLGAVANDSPLVVGGTPTATVQIANSIYINNDYFSYTGVIAYRPENPLIDITAQVDALVASAKKKMV
jgi:hypothetical protein